MNIDKMISMLLLKISQNHDIVYFEIRTYKKDRISKMYNIKIDDVEERFTNKKDVLKYLSKIQKG